jgi:hypothetical protein
MRFAKTVFTVAAIWGVVVLLPLYFSFDLVGRQYPPPITHPDFFYGFVGVAIVWQLAFFVIGREPGRFHLMMIPAVLEKFTYVLTLSVLYARGDLQVGQFAVAVPDFAIGVLFLVAFFKVGAESRQSRARAA